jgi:hypothetical protein
MRRLAFVLLTSSIVGLAVASPAQAYFPHLFHHPHFHHPHYHHFHHRGMVAPTAPVQPITPGQVIGAIHLGQQLFGLLSHGGQQQSPQNEPRQQPVELRVSPAVTTKLNENEARLNDLVKDTNALLELVRKGDPRLKDKLKDIEKAGGGGKGSKDGPKPGSATRSGFGDD